MLIDGRAREMEEFFEEHCHDGQFQDADGWFHFHRTTYTYGRQQEPEQEEEEDAVDAAMAPHVDPRYGDRRRHSYHYSYYRPPPPPMISFQQSRSRRPRSPSPAGGSNKRACVPASNKAIVGLKEVTNTNESDECAICLKALADGRPADQAGAAAAAAAALRAMPCSHVFHQHCIFQWLRRNAACPLCRHQLPTTTGDDEDEDEDEEVDDDDDDEDEEEEEDMEGRRCPDWLRVFLEEETERQLQRLQSRRNESRCDGKTISPSFPMQCCNVHVVSE